MIIRGKDKGETGAIKRVIRSQNRVIVAEDLHQILWADFNSFCRIRANGKHSLDEGFTANAPPSLSV